MSIASRVRLLAAVVTCLAAHAAIAAPNEFRDPLDVPARTSSNATRGMLSDVVRVAEGRYVAVGRRGLILVSQDAGASWEQAKVPVSTDLLSASFADDKQGWAVGHAGVVLHTSDGGLSWARQLDGRALPGLMISQYKPGADSGDESAKRNLEEAERFKADGPGRPLLTVLFTDARHGIAVGAYNLAIRTEDGGRTWRPISAQLDNPQGMHLYGLAHIDGKLWIAGEQGVLLREEAGGRFAQVKTPYPGSFFGITGKSGDLFVFGLRGNVLRSTDGGASWKALQTGTQSNFTAGTLLPDGRLVLSAMSGEVLVSSDGGESFARLPRAKPVPQFGLAPAPDGVVMAGALGVTSQAIPPAAAAKERTETSSAR